MREETPDIAAIVGSSDMTSEAAAHAVLRLVADCPGQMGRLKVARIVCGFPVHDGEYLDYAIDVDWPVREMVDLVDALLNGGLLTQSIGARPCLILTRAGCHALDALEAVA